MGFYALLANREEYTKKGGNVQKGILILMTIPQWALCMVITAHKAQLRPTFHDVWCVG